MTDDLALAGFAGPTEGLDRELLDLLVADHARQVVQAFLERRGSRLDVAAPGVSDGLARWIEMDDSFETAWHVSFGDLHAALLSDDEPDDAAVATAAALRLSERGLRASWEARFRQPTHLRFGAWVLPKADELHVAAAGDRVDIDISGPDCASTIAYRWGPDGWSTEDLAPLPALERAGMRVAISSAHALSPTAARRLFDADAYSFSSDDVGDDDGWSATCREALTLIDEAAGEYVPWVASVLREIVPLRARPREFNSGSERFSPGVICVSNQNYRWMLAEMIVHESTHQYMNILTRLGPIDDGSDDQLHYSPFRDKDRPIMFLVVAYHAFANVLLFYRSARENGHVPDRVPESDAFSSREETLALQLQQIEGPLERSTALTSIGAALWEPLRDRVNALVS